MDSICPQALKQHPSHNIVPHGPWTTSRCRPEINFLISAQLKASAKMVEDWTMPSWSQPRIPAFGGQDWTRITALERFQKGFSSTSSSSPSSSASPTPSSRNRTRSSGTTALTIYPFNDGIEDKSSPEFISENSEEHRSHSLVNADSPPPPPTILLRCKEYVPVSNSENPNAISKVDITRDRRLLGWDEYNPDLIQCVLDIPGHHFSLFAEQNVSLPLYVPLS